jgi:hypothetical protein
VKYKSYPLPDFVGEYGIFFPKAILMQRVLGIRKGVRYRWLRFWRRGSAGTFPVSYFAC